MPRAGGRRVALIEWDATDALRALQSHVEESLERDRVVAAVGAGAVANREREVAS